MSYTKDNRIIYFDLILQHIYKLYNTPNWTKFILQSIVFTEIAKIFFVVSNRYVEEFLFINIYFVYQSMKYELYAQLLIINTTWVINKNDEMQLAVNSHT